MSLFHSINKNQFPPLHHADENGLIAIGGNLTIERLLEAYSKGIFPWPNGNLLLWFAPEERFLIKTNEIYISKSMRKLLRENYFRITFDTCFNEVIKHCAKVYRANQSTQETWINEKIIEKYSELHQLGIAHSVEVWDKTDNLVGGLYGLEIGRIFAGESMFSIKPNASKYALIVLSKFLHLNNIDYIDCQVETSHLKSMGAFSVHRNVFVQYLQKAIQFENLDVSTWKQFTY